MPPKSKNMHAETIKHLWDIGIRNTIGTMNEICKIAKENSENLIASLQASINLISDVFNHQSLKNESFEIFTTASETEIERF
ncbi:2931_t:CDS:2 [Diversispora eburnea]|uniref:2931_t:CDS:1 n=1 Tax=Diversispora eburnea TaxID=1213867 RepID=A0A9N9C305_9GLOM|nr:2931_t:CDS:2 [Diversispora eburnea]